MCSLFLDCMYVHAHIYTQTYKNSEIKKIKYILPLGYEEFFETFRFFIPTISEFWSRDPIWFFEVLIEEKKILT